MKKIEYVWRELLYRTIQQRKPVFGQQELAAMLGLSSSTVNLALAPLRRLGAVTIGKRHSEVMTTKKFFITGPTIERFLLISSDACIWIFRLVKLKADCQKVLSLLPILRFGNFLENLQPITGRSTVIIMICK